MPSTQAPEPEVLRAIAAAGRSAPVGLGAGAQDGILRAQLGPFKAPRVIRHSGPIVSAMTVADSTKSPVRVIILQGDLIALFQLSGEERVRECMAATSLPGYCLIVLDVPTENLMTTEGVAPLALLVEMIKAGDSEPILLADLDAQAELATRLEEISDLLVSASLPELLTAITAH